MVLAGCPPRGSEPSKEGYYRVQLHLHGSLSEGDGSMRGQNDMAHRLGTVDGLWWTDHDWRIAGHGTLTGFRFESREESYPVPFRDTPWTRKRSDKARIGWRTRADAGIAEHWQRLSPDVVAEGGHSLEIGGRSRPGASDWQWTGIHLQAGNWRLQTPLAADPAVEIEVYPVTPFSAHQQLEIRLQLSRQPEGPVTLIYVLGAPGEASADHRAAIIPVSAPAGRWSKLALRPAEDATRLGLGGWDNALRTVHLGVQVRRGAEASFYVDHLRIRRQRSGAEVLARAEEMAASLAEEFELFNHVGLEISYGTHLNVYLPEIELPDFERYPHGMPPRDVVAWAHQRHGVASYNHVFGTGWRSPRKARRKYRERVRYLIENRAFGADLLEVGYPHRVLPLDRHLRVWDALSHERVFITGIGTSDSHSQTQGWRGGNNFTSWVWAEGPERRQLIAGLDAGRVFFGDPTKFQGEVHLATTDGIPMGQVVETAEPSRDVVARVSGLPEGCTVIWIDDGKTGRRLSPPAGDLTDTYRVNTLTFRFVRLEIWKDDKGVAFSNPVYFVPASAR